MYLLGPLLQSVGSVSSREIFTTLKSEVARSFSGSILNSSCIAEPLRCDPNRQRRVRKAAVPPRCDPTRGQRGEQCGSFSSSNGSSLAGAGRSAGLYPSDCSSRTILSSTCSSPGRGAATRCSAGNLASSRVAGSKIRSAWRSPGSASALRSKNMNGAGGPMCVDHGLSSSKRMSRRFAGSSTLRGKNMDGAGGLMCVGHGLRSSGSTSRSFADSSALRAKLLMARLGIVGRAQILMTCLSRVRLRHSVSILLTRWCGCHLHRTHTTCMGT